MKSKNQSKGVNIFEGLIITSISALFLLIFFGVFGKSGKVITDFAVGVLGYSVYGAAAAGFAVGVLRILQYRFNASIAMFAGLLALYGVIVLMFHGFTSSEYMGEGYKQYVLSSYKGADTAGGIIASSFMYFPMLLSVVAVTVATVLASAAIIFAIIKLEMPKRNNVRLPRERKVSDERDVLRPTVLGGRKKKPKNYEYTPLGESEREKEEIQTVTAGTQESVSDKYGDILDALKKDNNREKQVKEYKNPFGAPYNTFASYDARSGNYSTPESVTDAGSEKKPVSAGKSFSVFNMGEVKSSALNIDNYTGMKSSDMINALNGERRTAADVNNYVSADGIKSDLNRADSGETENKEETAREENEIIKSFDEKLNDRMYLGDINNAAGIKEEYRDFNEDIYLANTEGRRVENTIDSDEGDNFVGAVSGDKELNAAVNVFKELAAARAVKSVPEIIEEQPDERGISRDEKYQALMEQKRLANERNNADEDKKRSETDEPELGSIEEDAGYVYNPPPIRLLKDYTIDSMTDTNNIDEKIALIEDLFRRFKIDANVENAIVGPTVCRLECSMRSGTLKSIRSYTDDITACLCSNVIIYTPIEGKNLFGIEFANNSPQIVGMREALASTEFQKEQKPISIILGKDIENKMHVANMDDMPHLLIAGRTQSGKSVQLNVILCSILYKFSPQDVKLVLIDPKRVELNSYSGIPHMVTPKPITDADKAQRTLEWLLLEMNRRYILLEEERCTKLQEYNQAMIRAGKQKMPYLLVVLDEAGDLAIALGKSFERLVTRLAAKARAAGIHLILATQRPKKELISTNISANFPARIALATRTANDSILIMGESGAESLLGNGDAIYSNSGSAPVRIQGPLIVKNEVNAVCDYVRAHNKATFNQNVIDYIEGTDDEKTYDTPMEAPESMHTQLNKTLGFGSSSNDRLFVEMLYFLMTDSGNVSVSSLRSQFGVGYPKAKQYFKIMVDRGHIKDLGVNKAINISMDDFMNLYGDTKLD